MFIDVKVLPVLEPFEDCAAGLNSALDGIDDAGKLSVHAVRPPYSRNGHDKCSMRRSMSWRC